MIPRVEQHSLIGQKPVILPVMSSSLQRFFELSFKIFHTLCTMAEIFEPRANVGLDFVVVGVVQGELVTNTKLDN